MATLRIIPGKNEAPARGRGAGGYQPLMQVGNLAVDVRKHPPVETAHANEANSTVSKNEQEVIETTGFAGDEAERILTHASNDTIVPETVDKGLLFDPEYAANTWMDGVQDNPETLPERMRRAAHNIALAATARSIDIYNRLRRVTETLLTPKPVGSRTIKNPETVTIGSSSACTQARGAGMLRTMDARALCLQGELQPLSVPGSAEQQNALEKAMSTSFSMSPNRLQEIAKNAHKQANQEATPRYAAHLPEME